ncbi:LOW QUALITY PROTEIN: actin-2-like [Ciconia maguari]
MVSSARWRLVATGGSRTFRRCSVPAAAARDSTVLCRTSDSAAAAAGTHAVVFDISSGQRKAGLSGGQAPRLVISTVVGCPKFKLVMSGVVHEDCYIREEAQSKRGILSFTYPTENGVVTSWDDMEKIRYLYEQELKMKRSERPALLTKTPLNPFHREKMSEMVFESFQVPSLFVTLQALTAPYACARTTGLVLDSGNGVTVMVPVYKGCYLLRGITRLEFAGKGVTKYLARLLSETRHSFLSTAEEIVRDMKDNPCDVALDPSQNMQKKPEKLRCEYILHDGSAVKAGDQLV